jgi:hypothetical protein
MMVPGKCANTIRPCLIHCAGDPKAVVQRGETFFYST